MKASLSAAARWFLRWGEPDPAEPWWGRPVGQLVQHEPWLQMNHCDGPLLLFSDGTFRWLTWRERFLVWRGQEDARSLEAKLRPDLVRE